MFIYILNFVLNSIYTRNMINESDELDQLIELCGNSIEGKIWRGSHSKQALNATRKSIDTGYDSINKQLHSRGWPTGNITEFGIQQTGIGELRLLIPALRHVQQSNSQKHIVFIAPPHLPFAPALNKEGVDTNSLTIVRTKTLKDSLWAAEQSLVADCCAVVICWTGSHKIGNRDLRRLQLASENTHSWSVLFRHSRLLEEPSPSGLRIQLRCNSYSKLEIHILKQPQSWGGQKCTVSLEPHYENWQRLAVDLLPVHTPTQREPKKHQTPISPKQNHKEVTHPKAWNSAVTVIGSLSALMTVH